MKKLSKHGLLLAMMVALLGMLIMPTNVKAEDVNYSFVGGVVTIAGSGVADNNSLWQEQKSAVTKVIVGEGITEIGGDMFDGCENLASVELADSIVDIGGDAFQGCKALTSVELPSSLEKIGYHAFANTGLTKITIPKTLEDVSYPFSGTDIDTVTFEAGTTVVPGFLMTGCDKLKKVVWPNTITEIGGDAFEGCKSLTQIKLPSKLQKLGYHTFTNTGITKITIPKTLEDASYSFADSKVETVTFQSGTKEIPGFLMAGCKTLKKIVWGNDIKVIGGDAFQGCSKLTSITLPWYLEEIGYHTFYNCSSLKKITMYQNLTDVSEYAFDQGRSLTIYGKKGTYAADYAKKNNFKFSSRCKIPALKGYTYTSGNLNYKVIDDRINGKGTVMVVGMKKNAKSVVIPDTVKLESYNYKVVKINQKAFYKKSKLKTVTIKAKGIKSVGKYAFKGIYKKAVIQVPKSKYASYSKMLKKAGVTSKMKIKKK